MLYMSVYWYIRIEQDIASNKNIGLILLNILLRLKKIKIIVSQFY